MPSSQAPVQARDATEVMAATSDPNNVLSLTSLTETMKVNANTWTSTYTAATRTLSQLDERQEKRVIASIVGQGIENTGFIGAPAAGFGPLCGV